MSVTTDANHVDGPNRFRRAVLTLLVSAGLLNVLSGIAGEPIRFVRPKSDEKAPLRVDYSSEPAQAAEKRSIGIPEDSSGTRVAPSISVNRKARDATRKKWTTPEVDTGAESAAARARMDLQRWRLSQMEDERSSGTAGNAGVGGLFGFGGSQEQGAVRGGGEAAAASRPAADFGLRGLNDADPSRSSGRGNGYNSWGWNAQPSPAANSLRPEIPSSPSSLSPAPAPRIEPEPPGPRSPGPAIAPYSPRNFELPGRPR